MIADLRIKTIDNISYIGIPLGDPAYFSATNWEIKVVWGDGKINTIKSTYDSPAVAWDRKFDSAGNPTASAPNTGCLTLWHAYTNKGKYEIKITGGFGDGTGRTKFDNKLAFAKAEDRGLNSTPTLIEEITYWQSPSAGFYMHGQGEFEDFSNLKAINCNIKPLTSTDPENEIIYDNTGNGDLFCKNTFKNCINFTTPSSALKTFQFGKNNIINLEGFLEGCAYNHDLPWSVTRVTNFKNILKNSTRLKSFRPTWQLGKAKNLEGALQNSYFGTAKGFKLDQVSGLTAGVRYFKIIISESNNQNIIWCNDTEIYGEMTETLKENPHGGRALTLTVGAGGSITNESEVLGLGNGKNDFLPYNFDQIDGLDQYKMHVWHSDSANGTYTKELVSVGNPTLVRVQDEAFFYYLTDCTNAKNMLKDHKGFSSNFIKRWFFKNNSKNCNMEGLFEGAVCEDTQPKFLPWIGARPTSLKAFYRNTENNLPMLDRLNTSSSESIAYMFEDSKYGTGNTATSILNSWDLQKCQSTAFCFHNASYAGHNGRGIRDWFRKTNGDSKTFFDGIDAEGMFEGTCAYSAQSLIWGHFKPSSTKRMFRKNKIFNKKIEGWDMTSCTDISSMFRDSVYNQDTISDWKLPLVTTAKHCFDGSQFTGRIRDWFSETTLQSSNFAIKDISGMFQGSEHDGAGLKRWAKRMNHSVEFAVAFARNASNMKSDHLAKWFQGENVLSKLSHFFDGAKELNDAAKNDVKLWKVPNECNLQFNVLKGQSYQGSIGKCNYKSYENDDLCAPQELYQTLDSYVKTAQILPDVIFDSDFLPVGIYDTAYFRINTQ